MDGFDTMRKMYLVPAFVGARVVFANLGVRWVGTVVGEEYGRVMVRFDGQARVRVMHPTWQMRWLDVLLRNGATPRRCDWGKEGMRHTAALLARMARFARTDREQVGWVRQSVTRCMGECLVREGEL